MASIPKNNSAPSTPPAESSTVFSANRRNEPSQITHRFPRRGEIFVEIAGDQVSNLSTMVDTSQQLAGSLSEVVKQINLTKASAAQPAAQSTPPGGDAGGSGPLGVVENIASTVLQNVFGAVPLVKGILSLFGGGDSPAEAPLRRYVLPPSISFPAAET